MKRKHILASWLSGMPLDRAHGLRSEEMPEKNPQLDEQALVCLFWRGKPLQEENNGQKHPTRLAWFSGSQAYEINKKHGQELVFLGRDQEWRYFALALDPEYGFEAKTDHLQAEQFSELRQLASQVSKAEAAVLGYARSLLEWHRNHLFCGACGAGTYMTQSGFRRACEACGKEHFPRTDPVVIMLVQYEGSVLLGRQHAFPPGFYSALAGFIEPGETIEEACARELYEEAGLRVDVEDISYLQSQPWPFPGSLMIGLIAKTGGKIWSLIRMSWMMRAGFRGRRSRKC